MIKNCKLLSKLYVPFHINYHIIDLLSECKQLTDLETYFDTEDRKIDTYVEMKLKMNAKVFEPQYYDNFINKRREIEHKNREINFNQYQEDKLKQREYEAKELQDKRN